MTARDAHFSDRLVGSLRTGLVGIDAEGALAALSAEGAVILGCDPPEACLGRPVSEVLAGRPEVAALLVSALDGRERAGRAELQLADSPTRGAFTIGYTLLPVRDDDGRVAGAALLFRDLTPYERQDEQDRLRERLLVLGQLAAGLAHELRNPLASLEVLAGLLKRRLRDPDDTALLEDMLAEIRALAAVVSASLEYVRPARLAREPTALDTLADEALARARARVPFAGRVALEVAAGLPAARVDAERLRSALVDLLVNALQAMAAAPAPAEGHRLGVRVAEEAEGGIVVEVRDSGPGIPDALRERIFHPFFTTRAEGSGIGLAEVQKVVAAHGGSIAVGPAAEGGACFRIHLPVVEGAS